MCWGGAGHEGSRHHWLFVDAFSCQTNAYPDPVAVSGARVWPGPRKGIAAVPSTPLPSPPARALHVTCATDRGAFGGSGRLCVSTLNSFGSILVFTWVFCLNAAAPKPFSLQTPPGAAASPDTVPQSVAVQKRCSLPGHLGLGLWWLSEGGGRGDVQGSPPVLQPVRGSFEGREEALLPGAQGAVGSLPSAVLLPGVPLLQEDGDLRVAPQSGPHSCDVTKGRFLLSAVLTHLSRGDNLTLLDVSVPGLYTEVV